MKTLYVPLDEVILLLHTNFPLLEQERTLRNALKDIEYLPTIDPIEEIDKMIEEIHKKLEDIDPENIFWEEELDKLLWKKMWLLELKSRLSTNL